MERNYSSLELLVSAHQLLSYPSEYCQFNAVFEQAQAAVEKNPSLHELYIVQSRTVGGELSFTPVSAQSISRNNEQGQYFLTDICAVVRRPIECPPQQRNGRSL